MEKLKKLPNSHKAVIAAGLAATAIIGKMAYNAYMGNKSNSTTPR